MNGAVYAGGTIGADATDPDVDDTLTFSVVSGPAWLTVDANGVLGGTPTVFDSGANAFTVQVSDGTLTDTATLQIFVDADSTDFGSWQLEHFDDNDNGAIDPGAESAAADPNNDADGDGFTNSYEYFFGMDPRSSANENRPVVGIVNAGTDYPTITYARRIAHTENGGSIAYTVKTSDDLSAWITRSEGTGATDYTIVSGPTDLGDESGRERLQIRYNSDIGSLPNGKLFFRIHASE